MALAGGGRFMTLPPARHILTNIEILRKLLDIDIPAEQTGHRLWTIGVGK